MKKILSLVLVAALSLTMFAGCSSKGNNSSSVVGESSNNEQVDAATIKTAADLAGKKIAVQEGTTGDQLVTDTVEGAKVSRFKKVVDAGLDLKSGKVDAVVVDDLVAKKLISNIPGLMILDEALSVEEYAIAVKKGNTELLTKINEALKAIKDNGKYDAFVNAFVVDKEEQVALDARTESTATETVTMGTNAEFEPFEFRDNDKIVGFDIEIANEIADSMGKKLVIEDMAFDSLITALSAGKVDFVIAGMTATDERKANVDFSDSYFNASQVIIVRDPNFKG